MTAKKIRQKIKDENAVLSYTQKEPSIIENRGF
jgi:hypothetical protein